jgi:transcriptional regulator with XRE-family HTH domain
MDFGQWIQQVRVEHKLDVRSLAKRAGLDASTIRRIEHARTQATLSTAIRLCEGLGVTQNDVFQALLGKALPELEQEGVAAEATVVLASDVEAFLNSFHADQQACKTWLSTLLNAVVALKRFSEKGSTGNWLPLFVPEDIQKLLVDESMYRFEVLFPPEFGAEEILRIYRCGGFLTLAEIGLFVKWVRREKQVTLMQLEKSMRFSTSVLSRLESGSIEQIKLIDVLALDEQLEQGGLLLAMYWGVCTCNEKMLQRHAVFAKRKDALEPMKPEWYLKLISVYITICRWFQAMSPGDGSWIEHVRPRMAQSAQLDVGQNGTLSNEGATQALK